MNGKILSFIYDIYDLLYLLTNCIYIAWYANIIVLNYLWNQIKLIGIGINL
jgi:hypothetical protein